MATTVIDTFITRYAFQVDQQSARRVNTFVSGLRNRIRSLGGALTTLGVAGGFGVAGIVQVLREYDKATNSIKNNLLDLKKNEQDALASATKDVTKYTKGVEKLNAELRDVFTTNQHLAGISALMTGSRSHKSPLLEMYNRAVLPTAVAESTTPAEASDILTRIVRAYNLDDTAEQMKHVADVIASFATKHSLPLPALGRIITSLGERASGAGLGVREITGLVTYLEGQGQEPSRIDTALRAILSRLSTISSQPPNAQRMLRQYGFTAGMITSEFMGQRGGFIELLRQMNVQGLHKDDDTLRTLMGDEAYVIFRKMITDIQPILRELGDSTLATDNRNPANLRARVLSSDLATNLSKITANLQELAVAIGKTGVIEALDFFARALTDFLQIFTNILGEGFKRYFWGAVIAAITTGFAIKFMPLFNALGRGIVGRRKRVDAIAFELGQEWENRARMRKDRDSTSFRDDEYAFYAGEVQSRATRGPFRDHKKEGRLWRRLNRAPAYRGPRVLPLEVSGYKLFDTLYHGSYMDMSPDYVTLPETRGERLKRYGSKIRRGDTGAPNYLTNPILGRFHLAPYRERVVDRGVRKLAGMRNILVDFGRASTKWIGRMTRFLGSWGLLLSLGLELIPLLVRNWRGIIDFFQSPIQNLSRWFESLSGLQAPMKTPEQMTHEKKMREQHLYYDNWKKNMERLGIDRPSAGDKSASLNVNIGDIHVSAASNDTGEDIATGIRTSLVNQMHSALENFDSMVRV